MDIEQQLVIRVWKSFVELLPDFAVRRADVVRDHVSNDIVHIKHLGQLLCGAVVQECGALADNLGDAAAGADVSGVVEGFCEEPEAVDGAADEVSFAGCQQASAGDVRFPFLERVDFFPMLGDSADINDLPDQSIRDWDGAVDVSRLRGVVGDELNCVVDRPKLGFGGLRKDDELLG